MLDVIVGYSIAAGTIFWYGLWATIVCSTIGIPFFVLWLIPVAEEYALMGKSVCVNLFHFVRQSVH